MTLKDCLPRIIVACLFAAFVSRGMAEEPPLKPSVFDLRGLHERGGFGHRRIEMLLAQGKYDEAEKRLRETIGRAPYQIVAHYNLGCVLARQGKNDEALASLEKAVQLGFRDRKHIEEDEDLAGLRGEARFQTILALASEPMPQQLQSGGSAAEPSPIVDGQAIVSEKNVAWDPGLGVFRALFRFDAESTGDKPIAQGFGKAGELLRAWQEEGSAAGNGGDLYDNHDTDHSNMNYAAFPQLARVEFDEEARKRRLGHGLQLSFFYNAVTLGNSSTALTSGPIWRSQGRYALTLPGGPELLYRQYVGNHLYVYPEHRDHDPGHNGADGKGHGDVFPANTPYLILSQGSSGSDIAFLNAVAATLAAFRPEVKQALAKAGTLMPAVQMIFRTSNRMVEKPEDYLTGRAHPTVFDSRDLNVEKMVTLAHEIPPDALPPVVQIKVVEEDEAVLGRDLFDIAPRERLFDTPCAIARVVKSPRYLRRMVLNAEESRDPGGKPLTYHWAVLRGDAARIQINKLNDSGSRVELRVPYHERGPVAPGSELESNRVDIGVFVRNDRYFSAPAFISFFYLDNEKRIYDPEHRIQSVDYTDPSVSRNYVDPLLDFVKDWRDEYRYAADGTLQGWTRIRGEQREEFTPDGRLVVEKDDQARPMKTALVRYEAKPGPGGMPVLHQVVVPEPNSASGSLEETTR